MNKIMSEQELIEKSLMSNNTSYTISKIRHGFDIYGYDEFFGTLVFSCQYGTTIKENYVYCLLDEYPFVAHLITEGINVEKIVCYITYDRENKLYINQIIKYNKIVSKDKKYEVLYEACSNDFMDSFEKLNEQIKTKIESNKKIMYK